jgi:hypothetical protein
MADTMLCENQLDCVKENSSGVLTITMALGISKTLLVIRQDDRNYELSPPIDGLFAQHRNLTVEI